MMRSKGSQEGYLLIDHSASPGTSREMIQAKGDTPFVCEGAVFESATITCSHCGTVVILRPDRSRPQNHCRSCDHYICDKCAVLAIIHGCVPFSKIMDELERRIVRNQPLGDLLHGNRVAEELQRQG